MILKSLSVLNFRNFSKNTFYFNPFLSLIVGPNSVGKTNLLEAIYLLFQGQGIREEKQEELLSLGKNRCSLKSEVAEGDDKVLLHIELEKKEHIIKTCLVNKVRKKSNDFVATTPPVVLFTPQLIEEITKEPARRRKLFDNIISNINKEYKRRLINYSSALYKRNKILENYQQRENVNKELAFWDEYLINHGSYIQKMRAGLIDFFNQNSKIQSIHFTLNYKINPISKESLLKSKQEQFRLRKTIVGPQRDDYEIKLINDGKKKTSLNIQLYGSRSQQRLALLWIILNELSLYKKKLEQRPILLLDDIFSELDTHNRALVVKTIKKYQTIITSSNSHIVEIIDSPNTIINLYPEMI